jgi:hypothetical protein
MKASVGVTGGGGGKSQLPLSPKPLGELRVVPTISKVSFISEITKSLLQMMTSTIVHNHISLVFKQ